MRNADMALYRSKENGRGRHVTYDPSLHARAQERRRQEDALRHALEHEQFLLQYQPVVDLVNERVVGFEALLRWQSPTQGLVGPDHFVPLAEETGRSCPSDLGAERARARGGPLARPGAYRREHCPAPVAGARFRRWCGQGSGHLRSAIPQRLDMR
jgi:hypothetical protein